MNSSSLSASKNKSLLKQNSPTTLPPISNSSSLKYHNDYQSYEDELHEFKAKQQNFSPSKIQSSSSSSVSKNISNISSSLSSNSSANNKGQPSPKGSSPEKIQKTTQKVIPYEQSPNFWNSSQIHQPYIQYSEHEQYKNKSALEIQKEIRSMRKELQQMNTKLSERLNGYNLAKTEFVSKQLIQPSKREFYLAQIQTNRKVQTAQLAEIKKLNETQFLVKDKDALIDLENILIEMRQQIHQQKKEQHDFKLKNHKQDIFLDEIIKTNNDSKDNDQVKLLKLQIIYYIKRHNSLKTYQQQLDHEEKLIKQNDQNLNLKIEQIKKNSNGIYFWDNKFNKLRENYRELMEKKKTLQKNVETLTKANQIQEQKLAREILQIDSQLRKIINPKIFQYEETNYYLDDKINALITAYELNETTLKDIKYKFLQDFTHSSIKTNPIKTFMKNTLKPNFRPKSKIQQSAFITEKKNLMNNNTKSNEKLPTPSQRYNDKNISMTIDVNLQNQSRMKSISEGLNNLKPKNFRILSKRQNQNTTKIDKHSSFSTTIDYGPISAKSGQRTTEVHTARLLKPNLFFSKGNISKR